MDDALDALGRAVDVGAVGVALAGQADQRPPHDGHAVGNFHVGLRRLGTPGPVEHRPHHLGDHVARLAHDDQVAGPDVLRRHLVLVVQRGQPTVEPPTKTGSSRANGVARPVRPIETSMSMQPGRALLGRELEGDGPAGRARRGAQPLVQGQVVDLHHHAVDLVGQVVPVLGELAAPGHHWRRSPITPAASGLTGKPASASSASVAVCVAAGQLRPPGASPSTTPTWYAQKDERPGGRDPRVLLAQRSGGRVPRVHEELRPARPAGARSSPRTRPSACRSRPGPRAARGTGRPPWPSSSGTSFTVATFAVTSSPVTPSPRVAACTKRPRS